jgi:hypothetical protein
MTRGRGIDEATPSDQFLFGDLLADVELLFFAQVAIQPQQIFKQYLDVLAAGDVLRGHLASIRREFAKKFTRHVS